MPLGGASLAAEARAFLTLNGAEFQRGLKENLRSVDKWRQGFDRYFKLASIAAIGALTAIGAVAVKNYNTQERSLVLLTQAVRSTGGAAGFTAGELAKMAGGLQAVTRYGDETIERMQAKLLTFTNIRGEVFEKTTEAVLDVATAMDQDASSAAIQLGKALNDPVANLGALSRTGIQFSLEQKETIKTLVEMNRLSEAQGIILGELSRQFGGQARADALRFGGSLDQLKNTIGDILERIGALMIPTLQRWVRELKTFVNTNGDLIVSLASRIVEAAETVIRRAGEMVGVLSRNWAILRSGLEVVFAMTVALYGLSTAIKVVHAAAAVGKWGIIITAIVGFLTLVNQARKDVGGLGNLFSIFFIDQRIKWAAVSAAVKTFWAYLKQVGEIGLAVGRTVTSAILAIGEGLVELDALARTIGKALFISMTQPWRQGEMVEVVKDAWISMKLWLSDNMDFRYIWQGLGDGLREELAEINRETNLEIADLLRERARIIREGAAAGAKGVADTGVQGTPDFVGPPGWLAELNDLKAEGGAASPFEHFGPPAELFEKIKEEMWDLEDEIAKLAQHSKFAAKDLYNFVLAAATTAYEGLAVEARKVTSIEMLSRLQLAKVWIASVRAGVAAAIEARGREAAVMGAFETAAALSSLASGNFWSAAQHGAAAAKFFAVAGAAAVGSALVGGTAVGAGAEGRLLREAESGGGGIGGAPAAGAGGRSSVDIRPQVPQENTFNVYIQHYGGTVYGDQGLEDLARRKIIPIVRDAWLRGEFAR